MLATNIVKAIIKNKFNVTQYPSFITFFVTWRCNGRCAFCDVWKKRTDYSQELNISEVKKIFQQLKNVDVLRISGGEPFLRNDLAEIINHIEEINQPDIVHITTNGLLPEITLKTLKRIRHPEKIHIKISIDNIGKKHDKNRGIPGAYEKAMTTIKGLVKLRNNTNFHIGINHAILREEEIDVYFKLKKIFKKMNIPIYPGIATEPSLSLYSDKKFTQPEFRLLNKFSRKGLEKILNIMVKDGKEISDLKEKIVDKYYLKGLYNRLTENKNVPNPKCVAMNNHLRLLPNGDVPVCLYNGTIVGNLKKEKFKDIWFSQEAKKQRQWVKKCPGCWLSCEAIVSSIYTGDIWRGLFY